MADAQPEPCGYTAAEEEAEETDVPTTKGSTSDARSGEAEGHSWHHQTSAGCPAGGAPEGAGGTSGSYSCQPDRLEEDQAGTLWEEKEEEEEREEEEEEEEEEEDTSDTTGDEEEVDPRVGENLEIMNQSCAEVNRLENELDEARSKYRSTFQTSSQRMEELGGKIKKRIQRARHYFDLVDKAKQAQNEALRAARQFQSANGNHRAAIEMVTLAEKGLQDDANAKTRTLSSAWQETLSHAVERVTEAEREKTRTETEHNKRTAICAQLEDQIHGLEKKYKRSIAKARPYFETKAELELKLQQLKQNVWDLQQAIAIWKSRYADALRCLEAVSTEIHESRRTRKKMLLQYPREPGVGAETDSVGSSISDNANIERGVFSTSSAVFPDEMDDDNDDDDGGEDSDFESSGEVHGSDVGSSSNSDLRKKTLTRSLSKHAITHRKPQPEEEEEQDREAEDSGSACSQASGSVFSRSISGASVFSSEGQSDSSAPVSPSSPSVVAPAAVVVVHAHHHHHHHHHHHPSGPEKEGGPAASTSSSPSMRLPGAAAHPPSLVALARGDVSDGDASSDSESSADDKASENSAHPADVTAGVQNNPAAKDASRDLLPPSFSGDFPAEREAGDGSAQEDSPKERESFSSQQLPDPQSASLCSQLSSVVLQSDPLQAPVKATDAQVYGTSVMTKTASVTSASPTSQGVSGEEEVKKTPLRRTDVAAHRPLQGVMLLNPSDLAASSLPMAGPRF